MSGTILIFIFSIFRNHKSEGTILFLADVISASFGREAIEQITLIKNETLRSTGAPRIDPKFVNNYELSDIQFRVEGRIYYAHKLGNRYFWHYICSNHIVFMVSADNIIL